MDTVAIIAIGAVAGGFVQGLSGFAFGLVAMAFWAWSLPPERAAPLVVFGSWLGQIVALHTVRYDFQLRRALPFILGGLVGVPLGAALLPYLDTLVYQVAVGTLLVVWCPAMLALRGRPHVTAGGRAADGVSGLLGGVMGGLGGLTGPAPTLWCTLRGWDKGVQRAVFQAFNLCMHTLTLTLYARSGLLTGQTLRGFAIVAPALLLPTWLGARIYHRIDDAGFRRVVLLLLFASGAVLIATGTPGLVRRYR